MNQHQQKQTISFRTLLSEGGMSLLEVMVAAGILGVISIGVMQLNQNMSRSSKRMNQQLDIVQLTNKIQPAISVNESCQRSFRMQTLGEGLPATGANGILDGSGNSVIKVGDKYGNLTVTGITFFDVKPAETTQFFTKDPNNPSGPAIQSRKRAAKIRVDLRRGITGDDKADRHSTVGTLETSRFFETVFFVDASNHNRILDCHAQGTGYGEEACRTLQGRFDGDRCRSISIANDPTTPNAFAARFQGNVEIAAGGAGATGTLSVAGPTTLNALTVNGATVHNALTTVNARLNINLSSGGQLCLNNNCITTWNVVVRDCTFAHAFTNGDISNLACPANYFMVGIGRHLGPNPDVYVIRCCRAHIK